MLPQQDFYSFFKCDLGVALTNRKLQTVPPSLKLEFLRAAARERLFALHIHASPAERSAAGVLRHVLLSRMMSNSPRGLEPGCARKEEEKEEGVEKQTAHAGRKLKSLPATFPLNTDVNYKDNKCSLSDNTSHPS